MEQQEYYLGLDMGTSSIGWAVTDKEYNLLRAKGKDLWGIREFEPALPSVERRTARISRRNNQKSKVRIGYLKKYFADSIKEIDPYFYERLENSKYYYSENAEECDKDEAVASPNGVFDDADYTDKEYFHMYPTIFHLRKELIENEDPHDVRLVFLALLNMFKHRGHFLNMGLSDEESTISLTELYHEFVDRSSELLDLSFQPDLDAELIEILSDRSISRTRKSEKAAELFGVTKKEKKQFAIIKCFCGLKTDPKQIFENLESEEKTEFSFADFGYEEKSLSLQENLPEEVYQYIEILKGIYDIGTLAGVLKGYPYLSFSRVADYEKHHADLQLLKQVYKRYLPMKVYNKMFRSEEPGTYNAYVGSYNSKNSKLRRDMKGRSREELYKTIKSDLKNISDDRDVDYILQEIAKESFLPKQLTAGNGIIPNQVHKKEMRKILSNAEKYLPFLSEIDEPGLSTKERILALFSFQIPYYVGPTTNRSKESGGNGWVIRKEEGTVLPWNMEQKIDMGATQEAFIENLIRDCTYLDGMKVMPKGSLAYERYCVLNEINNIRVHDERIKPELKQDIFRELFEKGKRVTRKQVAKYLIGRGSIQEDAEISGIDININNSLTSWGRFYAIFGERLREDYYRDMTEDIIRWMTIFGDSKDIVKERIQEKYPNVLTEKELKRILGFKYKDWGRLSKELLNLQGTDRNTGEIMSVLQALWSTEYNFMELINSDDFTFKAELQRMQKKAVSSLSDFSVEDLDEYYFSAPVKRMVWQTILLIKELTRVLGYAPFRLFIEMTRTEGEKGDKGRTNSRKNQLLELYKNIKDEDRDWKSEIEKADENGSLRSKKLYLYYTQMGCCMYTGEPIDLYDLLNDNKYDIDHIYPRHYVKDDNISNNLVLVKKTCNAYKSDNYPIPEVPEKATALWKRLHTGHFISDEKYRRLISRTPFSDEQKAGFIARQLVETSQGTKGVADLLKQLLPETTLVYSKAGNVSDFRRDYDLPKARNLNDFHHANDAYLNIVVGNVYYVRFTQNPINFIKVEKDNYNLGKMFRWDVKRGSDVAWITNRKDQPGTIQTVKKVMAKNSPLMTRMNFEGHGAIANATLYSKRKAKAENYFPLKTSNEKMQDVNRYGGYTSASIAYYFLVEHGKKGKRVRTIGAVPIYLKTKIESSAEGLRNYCIHDLKLVDPDIRLKKIKIQSLFEINGYRVHLSGRTGKQISLRNAVNLCIGKEWTGYAKKIGKSMETGVMDKDISANKNEELYGILMDKHLNGIYSKRQNPVGKMLEGGAEKFSSCSLEEQVYVLNQILLLSAIGGNTADMRLIGGSGMSGKMLIGQNISKTISSWYLINQSVTGLYESRFDLLHG